MMTSECSEERTLVYRQADRRRLYAQYFGVEPSPSVLTRRMMDQLDRCKDDDARRLLLIGLPPMDKFEVRKAFQRMLAEQKAGHNGF